MLFYLRKNELKRVIIEATELYNEHLTSVINIDDYPSVPISNTLPIKRQIHFLFKILEKLFNIKVLIHFNNPDVFPAEEYPNPSGLIFSVTVFKKNRVLLSYDTNFGKNCKKIPQNVYYTKMSKDGVIEIASAFTKSYVKI